MKHANDRAVLILGASRGIGRAFALECARRGHPVALFSRDEKRIALTAAEAAAFGGPVHWGICDVSDGDEVRDAVTRSIAALGRIDVAVCNAGVGGPEWMTEFTAARFRHVMSTNGFGVAHMLEHCLPHMLARGRGTIAGVSSLTDVRGYPGAAAYCASKAAVSTLLEAARVELRSEGIAVVTVRPGFVRTDMTDRNEFRMPLIISPERAARIMYRGIMRGRRLVQFPLPLVWLTRLSRLAPNVVFDRVIMLLRPRPRG